MPEIVTAFQTWEQKFIGRLDEMAMFLKNPPPQTKLETSFRSTKHSTAVTLFYLNGDDVIVGKRFSISKPVIAIGNNSVRVRVIGHIATRGLEKSVSMSRWGKILGMSNPTIMRCFDYAKKSK